MKICLDHLSIVLPMEEEQCDGGHKRGKLCNSIGKVPECREKKPIQHQGLKDWQTLRPAEAQREGEEQKPTCCKSQDGRRRLFVDPKHQRQVDQQGQCRHCRS